MSIVPRASSADTNLPDTTRRLSDENVKRSSMMSGAGDNNVSCELQVTLTTLFRWTLIVPPASGGSRQLIGEWKIRPICSMLAR